MLSLLELRNLCLVTLAAGIRRGDPGLGRVRSGHVVCTVAGVALNSGFVMFALLPVRDDVGCNRSVTDHALLTGVGSLIHMRPRDDGVGGEDDEQSGNEDTQCAAGHGHLRSNRGPLEPVSVAPSEGNVYDDGHLPACGPHQVLGTRVTIYWF